MKHVKAWRIASLVAVLMAVPTTASADENVVDAVSSASGSVGYAVTAAADEARVVSEGEHGDLPEALADDAVELSDDEPPGPALANEERSDEEQSDVSDEEQSDVSDEEMRLLEESLAADAAADENESAGDVETSPTELTVGTDRIAASGAGMVLDIALILDVALAAFSQEPLQIGAHDPGQSGFNFQQLELAMGANIDPYFRLDTNLVFSQFGVEVEEAYATTLALPWNLQARAGQFLTPFGRLNPTHPHSWDFLDQPLVNGKFFGGEGSRGLGVELSWLSPLPWFVELTGAANDASGECCARSFYGGDDIPTDGPEDVLYTTRLEQFFPFGSEVGLLWGLTAQFGPNGSGSGNRTEIYGTDLYLRWRPSGTTSRTSVDLTIEAMFRSRQVPDDLLQDFGTRTELVWNIDPRWSVGTRHEFVSGVENDPLDPEWSSDRQRVAVQGTFYPSHFSRIRLQGAWDAPTWREEPILGAMLGLEVLAGAHGAHEY